MSVQGDEGLLWGQFPDGIYLLHYRPYLVPETLLYFRDVEELRLFYKKTGEFIDKVSPIPDVIRKAFDD